MTLFLFYHKCYLRFCLSSWCLLNLTRRNVMMQNISETQVLGLSQLSWLENVAFFFFFFYFEGELQGKKIFALAVGSVFQLVILLRGWWIRWYTYLFLHSFFMWLILRGLFPSLPDRSQLSHITPCNGGPAVLYFVRAPRAHLCSTASDTRGGKK